jgi:transcriptional regulator with XRE-family HTH domain
MLEHLGHKEEKIMNTAMTYGGWVTDRPAATGVTSTLVRLVGWMTAAGAALTGIGTGGELSLQHLQRSAQQAQHRTSAFEIAEVDRVRTPRGSLSRIRKVLNPAVSDLAKTFGVSRQSVYNWLNGEPVANDNAARLEDLARAAEVLTYAGVSINSALLKRKFANGRTLMQVAQAGESAEEAALMLIQIHKREAAQRERMKTRFANRAMTPASADFDLPSPNDKA